MALIGSMEPALAGLRTQEFRIEVVGNNIANLDTTSFKSSRVEFSTTLSQVVSLGSAPEGNFGGTDPVQVGQGVKVGGMTRDLTQGSLKSTGIPSDLAISGEGFFVVRDSQVGQLYTRDGSFGLNAENLLYDPATGGVVQGWIADSDFQVNTGAAVTDLEIPIDALTIARETSSASFQGNLDPSGDIAASGTWLNSQVLYDRSTFNTSELISSTNPLALARATSTTLLSDLVSSNGDFASYDAATGTDGSPGTFSFVFPDLQNTPTGTAIELNAQKGGRAIEAGDFTVGGSLPDGGTTLGDFIEYLENSFGITDGEAGTVEHAYSFMKESSVNGQAITGFIGASDTFGQGGITIAGADFRGVENGDFIRFTSGAAAGEIAEITGVSASVVGGNLDSLTFATGAVNALTLAPGVGDTFTVNSVAGVGEAQEASLLSFTDGVGFNVSTGAVQPGGLELFSIQPAVPGSVDFVVDHGVQVNQIIEWNGGNTRATVTSVSPGSIEFMIAVGAPTPTGSMNIIAPADGTVEIAGNAGLANEISNIQIRAAGDQVSIFSGSPRAQASGESVTTTLAAVDSLGAEHQVELTLVFESTRLNGPNTFRYFAEAADDSDKNRLVGTGTVNFDSEGQFLATGSPTETITIDLEPSGGQVGGVTTPLDVTLDFSRLTQLADQLNGSQMNLLEQDGFRSGTLRNFGVTDDGTINGSFDNGISRSIGKVALARFANTGGLIDAGSNQFTTSIATGDAQIGEAGQLGFGTMRGGTLEESNVDLAEQFTQLIIGQRAFQANARTISTSDELLQELVNLI